MPKHKKIVPLCLATSILLGNIPFGVLPKASAFERKNNSIKIKKVCDGIFDTGKPSVINTKNGFPIGDDGPNDNVVASGDYVVYRVEIDDFVGDSTSDSFHLKFISSNQLAFDMSHPVIKTVSSDKGLPFSYNGVSSDHNSFSLEFKREEPLENIVGKIVVDVYIRAKDTSGMVIDADLYACVENNKLSSNTFKVVSSPLVDIRLDTTYNKKNLYSYGSDYISDQGVGLVNIERMPLVVDGYSDKGISLKAPIYVDLDVSSLPKGTEFYVMEKYQLTDLNIRKKNKQNGNHINRDYIEPVNGILTVPSEFKCLQYQLPDDFLEEKMKSDNGSFDFTISVKDVRFDDRFLHSSAYKDAGLGKSINYDTASFTINGKKTNASRGLTNLNNNYIRHFWSKGDKGSLTPFFSLRRPGNSSDNISDEKNIKFGKDWFREGTYGATSPFVTKNNEFYADFSLLRLPLDISSLLDDVRNSLPSDFDITSLKLAYDFFIDIDSNDSLKYHFDPDKDVVMCIDNLENSFYPTSDYKIYYRKSNLPYEKEDTNNPWVKLDRISDKDFNQIKIHFDPTKHFMDPTSRDHSGRLFSLSMSNIGPEIHLKVPMVANGNYLDSDIGKKIKTNASIYAYFDDPLVSNQKISSSDSSFLILGHEKEPKFDTELSFDNSFFKFDDKKSVYNTKFSFKDNLSDLPYIDGYEIERVLTFDDSFDLSSFKLNLDNYKVSKDGNKVTIKGDNVALGNGISDDLSFTINTVFNPSANKAKIDEKVVIKHKGMNDITKSTDTSITIPKSEIFTNSLTALNDSREDGDVMNFNVDVAATDGFSQKVFLPFNGDYKEYLPTLNKANNLNIEPDEDGFDKNNNVKGVFKSKISGDYSIANIKLDKYAKDASIKAYIGSKTYKLSVGNDGNVDLSPLKGVKFGNKGDYIEVISKGNMGKNQNQGVSMNLGLVSKDASKGDKFVLWPDFVKTDLLKIKKTDKLPLPVYTEITSSNIEGDIFMDKDLDYKYSADEEGYKGVKVTLQKRDDSDFKDTGLSTVTDSKGHYVFENLKHGEYRVILPQVKRSQTDNIADMGDISTIEDNKNRFGIVEKPIQSISYPDKKDALSSNASDVKLDIGKSVRDVNFGFSEQKSDIALDKKVPVIEDSNDSVIATWDVEVKNTGSGFLNDVKLTDRFSKDLNLIDSSIIYNKYEKSEPFKVIGGVGNILYTNDGYYELNGEMKSKNKEDYKVHSMKGDFIRSYDMGKPVGMSSRDDNPIDRIIETSDGYYFYGNKIQRINNLDNKKVKKVYASNSNAVFDCEDGLYLLNTFEGDFVFRPLNFDSKVLKILEPSDLSNSGLPIFVTEKGCFTLYSDGSLFHLEGVTNPDEYLYVSCGDELVFVRENSTIHEFNMYRLIYPGVSYKRSSYTFNGKIDKMVYSEDLPSRSFDPNADRYSSTSDNLLFLSGSQIYRRVLSRYGGTDVEFLPLDRGPFSKVYFKNIRLNFTKKYIIFDDYYGSHMALCLDDDRYINDCSYDFYAFDSSNIIPYIDETRNPIYIGDSSTRIFVTDSMVRKKNFTVYNSPDKDILAYIPVIDAVVTSAGVIPIDKDKRLDVAGMFKSEVAEEPLAFMTEAPLQDSSKFIGSFLTNNGYYLSKNDGSYRRVDEVKGDIKDFSGRFPTNKDGSSVVTSEGYYLVGEAGLAMKVDGIPNPSHVVGSYPLNPKKGSLVSSSGRGCYLVEPDSFSVRKPANVKFVDLDGRVTHMVGNEPLSPDCGSFVATGRSSCYLIDNTGNPTLVEGIDGDVFYLSGSYPLRSGVVVGTSNGVYAVDKNGKATKVFDRHAIVSGEEPLTDNGFALAFDNKVLFFDKNGKNVASHHIDGLRFCEGSYPLDKNGGVLAYGNGLYIVTPEKVTKVKNSEDLDFAIGNYPLRKNGGVAFSKGNKLYVSDKDGNSKLINELEEPINDIQSRFPLDDEFGIGVSTSKGFYIVNSKKRIKSSFKPNYFDRKAKESVIEPIKPVFDENIGDFKANTYKIPMIAPGESATLRLKFVVKKDNRDRVYANQAYVTSDKTPRENIAGSLTPSLPDVPTLRGFNPDGIYGNDTAKVNTDIESDDDLADQVPLYVKADEHKYRKGIFKGTAFYSNDLSKLLPAERSYIRVNELDKLKGIKVKIIDPSTGLVVDEQVTDDNGQWTSNNIINEKTYKVVYDIDNFKHNGKELSPYIYDKDRCTKGYALHDGSAYIKTDYDRHKDAYTIGKADIILGPKLNQKALDLEVSYYKPDMDDKISEDVVYGNRKLGPFTPNAGHGAYTDSHIRVRRDNTRGWYYDRMYDPYAYMKYRVNNGLESLEDIPFDHFNNDMKVDDLDKDPRTAAYLFKIENKGTRPAFVDNLSKEDVVGHSSMLHHVLIYPKGDFTAEPRITELNYGFTIDPGDVAVGVNIVEFDNENPNNESRIDVSYSDCGNKPTLTSSDSLRTRYEYKEPEDVIIQKLGVKSIDRMKDAKKLDDVAFDFDKVLKDPDSGKVEYRRVGTYQTDKDGVIKLDLEEGEYRIVEKKEKFGYIKPDGDGWFLTVKYDENGNMKLSVKADSKMPYSEVDGMNLKLYNYGFFDVPLTGGNMKVFMFGGIAMLLLGSIVFIIRKKD